MPPAFGARIARVPGGTAGWMPLTARWRVAALVPAGVLRTGPTASGGKP